MLAVPASAYALTTSTAPDVQAVAGTPLTMKVTPALTHFDRAITVTGRAPASDARDWVILEGSSGREAPWRYLASARIASEGTFALRTVLGRSTFVRVVDTANTASAASISPNWAASPAQTNASAALHITVAAQFKLHRRSINVLGGERITVRGTLLPAVAGRFVRIQARAGNRWHALANARTGRSGRFALRFLAGSGMQRRLRLLFAGDGANGRSFASAGSLTVYGQSYASWYDDAGNTACGFHATFGVANRALPCGTKVRFRYGGRSVTATVDDRGPFVAGRDWDLNQNTASALGFGGVGAVWVTL